MNVDQCLVKVHCNKIDVVCFVRIIHSNAMLVESWECVGVGVAGLDTGGGSARRCIESH